MLAIFVALSCVFLSEHFSFAQAFAVLQRILHRHSVGDFVLTPQREMLFEDRSILSVLGAVIAQSGRQFYENELLFQYGYGIMIYEIGHKN